MLIVAADIGGTKTRLALADANNSRHFLYEACYSSSDFTDFESMLRAFLKECDLTEGRVEVLTLALPGLVSDLSARLTNLPWIIEKQSLKDAFGISKIHFMNDFQASAIGIDQLQEQDSIVLNTGVLNSAGFDKKTIQVAVGAGTGLGVAWMQNDILNDEKYACATEGGHIDFAPVDEIQIKLLQFLKQRFDHVSYERILSGDGLVSIYHFCAGKQYEVSAEWINRQSKKDPVADRAVSLFVQVYGAYIGNIALLFKPYGGIFITGGIGAKLIEKMQSDLFLDAYLNKGRMRALVEQIPVYLVTNERIGVLGAMSETVKI